MKISSKLFSGAVFSGTVFSRALIPGLTAALLAGTALSTALSGTLTEARAEEPGTAGTYLAAIHAEAIGDVASSARLFGDALSHDPDNLALLERAMTHQIAAGNVPRGIELAARMEEIKPGHHLGVLALAAGRLKAGDPEGAAAQLDGQMPFVGQIMAAWAHFGEGEIKEAVQSLIRLAISEANGRPGQILAAFHLGMMQAAAGDDESAVDAFAQASELSDGGTLKLAQLHASALARLGRTEEAQAVIEARLAGSYGGAMLIELGQQIAEGAKPAPVVTTASAGAAEVLFGVSGLLARGQNRLIALSYSRLATWLAPELGEAQLLIAQILHDSEQFDQAIAAYRAVPDNSTESLSAEIGLADALQQADRTQAALNAMQAVIERYPDALEAHTAQGDMLRREERFAEAASAYDRAIALIGEDAGAQYWPLYFQRGVAFERSKQWKRAEADFLRALELEPDQPDVLNYLGYSWVDRGERLDEAERMIRTAVEQRPDDGYIVDSLGWVLFRFGEFGKAAEQLERAVELLPVDPVINDHYGDVLWMIGRRTEARFQWKRALSFEPEEDEAERIRAKLSKGLDAVLAAEEKDGRPGIVSRQ
ncbi:MAG TPA: tetratricopeptide repeat protein, partial [Paracoccaceae bacterium]|nr:tetratricopeptide repeat protein [Paracoccaceae bacterium]